jgi:hypothetical protein
MLDLPPHLIPEWILIAGHPKPQERVLRAGAPNPLRARDLTYWERAGLGSLTLFGEDMSLCAPAKSLSASRSGAALDGREGPADVVGKRRQCGT